MYFRSGLHVVAAWYLALLTSANGFTTNDDSLLDSPRDPNDGKVFATRSFAQCWHLSSFITTASGTRWLPIHVGEEGNESELFFDRGDDDEALAALAHDFTVRFGLGSGVDCEDDPGCLRGVIIAAMKRHSESSIVNTGGGGANNKRDESQVASGRSPFDEEGASSGTWAAVPCVPPYCAFECARAGDEEGSGFLLTEAQRDAKALREWGGDFPPPRQCPKGLIHPIGFGVPEESVVGCVPVKSRGFAINIVASGNYQFGATEEHEYRRQLRSGFYAHTRRKMGWEAMRHYEILAAGTVPFFTNLSTAPPYALPRLPKRLLLELMRLPGVDAATSTVDPNVMPAGRYYALADALLRVTRQTLTTRAVAADLLSVVHRSLPTPAERSVPLRTCLFLSGDAVNSDYQRDVVLHGLKAILGAGVVDYASPRHMYRQRNGEDTFVSRAGLHGLGYAITGYLEGRGGVTSPHQAPNQTSAQQQLGGDTQQQRGLRDSILRREFDVVVFGSVRRGMPFWPEVEASYPRERIVFVEGEDTYTNYQKDRSFSATCELLYGKGHYLLREMPSEGCPEPFI